MGKTNPRGGDWKLELDKLSVPKTTAVNHHIPRGQHEETVSMTTTYDSHMRWEHNPYPVLSIAIINKNCQAKKIPSLWCCAEDLSLCEITCSLSVRASAGTWHTELAVNYRTELLSRHKYLFTTPIILIFRIPSPTLITRDWAQHIHTFKTYASVTMTTSSMHPISPISPVIRTM